MRTQRNRFLFKKRIATLSSLFLTAALLLSQVLPVATYAESINRQSKMDLLETGRNRVNPSQFLPFDDNEGQEDGLLIRLSEGAEQPDEFVRPHLATSQSLSEGEIQQIIARLPDLEIDIIDVQEFRLPEASLPPPRTGETIDETFPLIQDGDSAPPVTEDALDVLRYAPVGDVPIAPFVNITFSQPMIALATLQQLDAQEVLVKITPELPGVWKWLGTRTLSFEHRSDEIDRLPMATEYTVEIPAGIQSATGSTLQQTVTWTFRTPLPVVQSFSPNYSPQPLDPLFFVSFDQRIDPEAVLESIDVTAAGESYGIQLANEDEIAQDEQINRLSQNAPEGRWLTFRTQKKLPTNTTVTINVGPNTPSAEGPLTTDKPQSYSFQTYAPLRIHEHRCGYGGDCPPFAPFIITFKNPLDAKAFEETQIRIEPEIPGVSINVFGNTIQIQGATSGRTTYSVIIDGALRDQFGQTLGQDETLTFSVGLASQLLTGPSEAYITLDPSANPAVFTVYSINYEQLNYRAYAVTPEDWSAYLNFRLTYYGQQNNLTPPGREVDSQIIKVQSQPDELTETAIDLSAAIAGATENGSNDQVPTAQLIVIVEPASSTARNRPPSPIQTWVQVTQIGLDAFVDHSEMVVWTSALKDETLLHEVELTLLPGRQQAVTGSDGTATLSLTSQEARILIARYGNDTAFLPKNPYFDGGGWRSNPPQDELRWYVFDDRQMYRPGEEVHIKGWVRHIGSTQEGDVGLFAGAESLTYRVIGSQGNEVTTGEAEVNAVGGFDIAFDLPENVNLGIANVQFSIAGGSLNLVKNLNSREYWHSFQIQEFRRPEFEVTAGNETIGPYFLGDEAVVFVNAAYFSGGPLPNAETFWTVQSSPTNYTPPGWRDYVFGIWTPWWFFDPYDRGGGRVESFNSRTDATGTHYLRMEFEENENSNNDVTRPYSIMADATVMDVNRQAWSASTSLMVHPADLYVGLRSERTFVQRGEPLEIEAIATDLDGKAIGGRTIVIQAARLEWKVTNGRWKEEEAEVQKCTLTSTTFPETEPTTCEFTTEQGGRYRITATVEDAAGRQNQSQFVRWVSGGKRPPARKVEQEEVTLIPDKQEYTPGDVAKLLVQSPFALSEGLLTVTRNGILYTERFEMSSESTVLRVPIEEVHIPNLHVQVDLVGAAPRLDADGQTVEDLPARPAYATGSLTLDIPPVSRTLALDVTPQVSALEPGGSATVDLVLTDADGAPVADAELAVVVVDEAILALTNYQLTDPLTIFYGTRPSMLRSFYSRASIVLANPALLAEQAEAQTKGLVVRSANVNQMAAPSAAPAMEMDAESGAMAFNLATNEAGADDGSAAQAPIAVRSNFNPLALFAPEVRTDEEGTATVDIDLPDNLIRYRIMVVAVAGENHFGMGEANLTARLPLMVRPSAPRFLNFGDSFELPVVLQNQMEQDLEVNVVVQATNIDLTENETTGDDAVETDGQRVTIPANDRVEIRFPAATLSAGTARFQFAATSGSYADAQTADLPVYTPATTEAFATYGVIDDGVVIQPILQPEDVFPQFGALEIDTSSTALQALTDVLLYLATYPYECSEQLASRIMAISTLRDVLTAFEAEGLPSPEEIERAVERDVERLEGLQNPDGGYPVWTRGRESLPYYSIFVTHALKAAQEKGFPVPDRQLIRALEYLRNIERYYPHWYSQKTRWSLSTYAIYVRSLINDVDTLKARTLFEEAGINGMPMEGLAWLLQVMGGDAGSQQEADAIRRHFQNRAVETAGAANFTTSYGDDEWVMLHSNRRTDGVILDALIIDKPESDLIPKVVNGLLAHRTRGRWRNTQENVFILLALDRYFNTFKAQTPDFVVNIWLGDQYVGDHEFVGRTTDRRSTDVPMDFLMGDESGSDNTDSGNVQNLILSKEGDGRLYYRLGLRYAPTDLNLPPEDRGFVVQRSYEAVDDPDDVSQDEDGIWQIRTGARVRVRLTMVADSRRYHVALVDPLPAGLEIINAALAVSESVPSDPNDDRLRTWWWGTWYDHQNLRDERAEAFATLLWDGVYNYSYVARATTPGEFVVPPAKAEEMYSPEVFGRSAGDRVVVGESQQN